MALSFRYSEPNNTIYPSDAPKQHICHSSLSFYFFFGELMRIMSCSKMPQQNKRNNHPSLLVFYMQNSCVSSSTYKQRHQIRGKPAVTAAARKGGDLQRGPERLLGVQHKPWLGAGTSLPSLSSHQLSVLGLLTTRQQLDSHQKPHPPCEWVVKSLAALWKSPVPGPQQRQKGRILPSFFSPPTSTTILPQVWLL